MQPVLNGSSLSRCTFSLKMFLLFVVFNPLLGGMLLAHYKGKVWRWPFSGSVWPKAWIPFRSKPPAATLGTFRQQQLSSTKYVLVSEWLVGALVRIVCNNVLSQVCNVIYGKVFGVCNCLFTCSWRRVALSLFCLPASIQLRFFFFLQELCGAITVSPNSDVFLLACFIVRLLRFSLNLWKSLQSRFFFFFVAPQESIM